jgi:predicted transcriptional regulator
MECETLFGIDIVHSGGRSHHEEGEVEMFIGFFLSSRRVRENNISSIANSSQTLPCRVGAIGMGPRAACRSLRTRDFVSYGKR